MAADEQQPAATPAEDARDDRPGAPMPPPPPPRASNADGHDENDDDDDDDDYVSEDDPDFDASKPDPDDGVESDGSDSSSGSVSGDEEDEDEDGDGDGDASQPPRKRRRTGDAATGASTGAGADAGTAKPVAAATSTSTSTSTTTRPRPSTSMYAAIEGDGGLVKTRAQKLREQDERRAPVLQGVVTVDVDALWRQLSAQPITAARRLGGHPGVPTEPSQEEAEAKFTAADTAAPVPPPPTDATDTDTITIRRTYEFAGETVREARVVPRSSAEAKLYLASLSAEERATATAAGGADDRDTNALTAGDGDGDGVRRNDAGLPLQRPLARPSRFDPNPPGSFPRSWVRTAEGEQAAGAATDAGAGAGAGAGPSAAAHAPAAVKLNTVQKSHLDWTTYVDRTGIQEELEAHSRAKEGYLARMDFLSRVDAKREEERRAARLKGV